MTHFPERVSSDESVGLISWRHLAEYLAGPLRGWKLGGYVHDDGVGASVTDLAADE